MQHLEGGATGPNGRDSRIFRPAEQEDPADSGPAPERGSLMSRYRGSGLPVPGTEDEATPPTGETPAAGPAAPGAPGAGSPAPGAPGAGPAPAAPAAGPAAPGRAATDPPWRQSSWTSAPPVRPAMAPPPAGPSSSVPPAGKPTEDKTATGPSGPPAADRPAARPTADGPGDAPTAPAPSGPPAADRAAARPTADGPGDAPTAPAPSDPPAASTTGAAAVTVTRDAGTNDTAGGLLSTQRAAEFRQRWRDLQADFVDDPQQAVRGAGELSREILQALSDTIAAAERVDRWKAEDGTSGTEDLRVALRQYRTLVNRLLEL
jgi:hypothetical protein